tara:strand:- start:289 stop:1158 length:870 start_codon:yes stop_codon:yes gene_type:complete
MYSGFITDFSKIFEDLPDSIPSMISNKLSADNLEDINTKDLLDLLKRLEMLSELLHLMGSSTPQLVICLQQVIQELRGRSRAKMKGLYVIIDPDATNNRNIFDVTKAAIEGGVSVVQYRDKKLDRSYFLNNSFLLKEICDESSVSFVVNDAVDVARLVNSSFLHVGQSDMEVEFARKLLLSSQCIGTSNNGLAETSVSEEDGSDYLAVGAVYATSTMGKSSRKPVGTETLVEVKSQTDLPVVAIGGINESNLAEVRTTGVDAACIVSSITCAANPEKSVKELLHIWENA